MADDALTDAIDILRWAQRSLETRTANKAGYGSPELADAVATPVAKPGVASTAGGRRNSLAEWKRGKGYDVPLADDWPLLLDVPPTVLVKVPWATLAPTEVGSHVRNRVWLGTVFASRVDDWVNQPRGSLFYPNAANAHTPPDEHNATTHPPVLDARDRVHRVGVLSEPSQAPATPDGTHALVVAAVTCDDVANALDVYAEGTLARQATRYRAEARTYREHADACTSALSGSLSWVGPFEMTLEPIPPFAPINVPAQLRGYVTVSPI